MTNANVEVVEICPLGGTGDSAWKLGFVKSGIKAAQSDTWTVTNAVRVGMALIADDSTGVLDAPTISGNVITLTGAQTLATTGLLVYRE